MWLGLKQKNKLNNKTKQKSASVMKSWFKQSGKHFKY